MVIYGYIWLYMVVNISYVNKNVNPIFESLNMARLP